MSTVATVGIGLAWAIMAAAAFIALSASALAHSRHELEVDPGGATATAPHAAARGRSHGGSEGAIVRAQAHAHWPAIETIPTSAVLRSSPSAAYMRATSGHAGTGPIRLS